LSHFRLQHVRLHGVGHHWTNRETQIPCAHPQSSHVGVPSCGWCVVLGVPHCAGEVETSDMVFWHERSLLDSSRHGTRRTLETIGFVVVCRVVCHGCTKKKQQQKKIFLRLLQEKWREMTWSAGGKEKTLGCEQNRARDACF